MLSSCAQHSVPRTNSDLRKALPRFKLELRMTATFVKTAASMSVLIMIIKSIKASSAFAPQSMVLPPKVATVAVSMTLLADSSFPSQTLEITSFPRGPKRVAVTGATGRTGRLVVDELLRRKVKVVALVRDLEKAATTLPPPRAGDDLTILQCDLGNEEEIQKSVNGCGAAIWCATGFSDAQGAGLLSKAKRLLGFAFRPKESIDAIGVPALAKAFLSSQIFTMASNQEHFPKVVMLSSAAVTRPGWNEDKKKKFRAAADIPIVILNPFGLLDVKAESEEKLRRSGVDYSIFRPCGLNDNWPAGSRPVFSQGDVAVGRINRRDVAKILVDLLSESQAVGKTFEGFSIKGYLSTASVGVALSLLSDDSAGKYLHPDSLTATYAAMQQLLPGESQDDLV